MDCRTMLLLCLAVFLSLLIAFAEGHTKKVVIHVPYKVRKLKHTHTIYKTVHHHHTHHDHADHGPSPLEEHEHFHHFHIHDDPHKGQHIKPVSGFTIPDFLPDAPLDIDDLPDFHNGLSRIPTRHVIPPYRRLFKVESK